MEEAVEGSPPDPWAYVALAEMGKLHRLEGKFSLRGIGKIIGKDHGTVRSYISKLEEYHRITVATGPKNAQRLTPEGVHLAALAQVFRDSQNALHTLRSFGRPILRIGAFHTTFRSVLPLVFREIHGSFDLDLIEGQSHEELLEHLQTGISDIAFGWSGEHEVYLPELNEKELTSIRVGIPCKMVAIASATLDATFGGRSFESLEDARTLAANSGTRLILDRDKAKLFRDMGILKDKSESKDERGNLVLCQNMGTIISLVQRGLGVGIVWDMGDLLKGETVLKATFKKELLRPIQLVAYWRTEHYTSRKNDRDDPMVKLVEQLQAK